MRHHLNHLLMCAPMILVAAVLLVTGSGIGILIPLAACMLMMGGMEHGEDGGGHGAGKS